MQQLANSSDHNWSAKATAIVSSSPMALTLCRGSRKSISADAGQKVRIPLAAMSWKGAWGSYSPWRQPQKTGRSQGRHRRPYTVCSCGGWIFNSRIGNHPFCRCGQPWLQLGKGQPQSVEDVDIFLGIPSPEERQWRTKVEGLLQEHWEALPPELREVLPSPKAQHEDKKEDDSPQEVTARYKAQSAKLRTLGQKKLQLSAREEKLQSQLQETQEEIRKVQDSITEAQSVMEQISEDFAKKVLKPNLLEPEVPNAESMAESPIVRFQKMVQELGAKLSSEDKEQLQVLGLDLLREAGNKRQKIEGPSVEQPDAAMGVPNQQSS